LHNALSKAALFSWSYSSPLQRLTAFARPCGNAMQTQHKKKGRSKRRALQYRFT